MPPTYRRPLLKRWWYSLSRLVMWCVTKVYFRYRFRGGEHVPRHGPLVILCNHQSNLDPVLVGVACPRQLSFLARDTLFVGWFAWLIRSFDAIPIDREGTSLGGIRATLGRLKKEGAVLLFPEGTRTPDGKLQPLKPGFAALVRRSNATIVPAALTGAFAAMPRGGKLPRPVRIALEFGPMIAPQETAALNDEQLVQRVTERMAACFSAAERRIDYCN
ncbi:MAG: lysophospholipid acyltransferase family protein [Pirellulales bacterium]